MNILVLGANGQLGKGIRERVEYQHQRIEEYKDEVFFASHNDVDITDKKTIDQAIETYNIKCVINCAAYTNVSAAENNTYTCAKVNCQGVENIGYSCNEHNVNLIHISTDYVFDGEKNTPYSETDKCNPISVYGLTKREGEIRLNNQTFHNNRIIIRTSWLYSKYDGNFLTKINQKIQNNEELKVVYDQIGTPTSTSSLAHTIFHIIDSGWCESENGECKIYHYSNEGCCSWYDFAQYINILSGKNVPIKPIIGYDMIRPNYSVLSKAKIKTDFGLYIPHWMDEVKHTFDLIKK